MTTERPSGSRGLPPRRPSNSSSSRAPSGPPPRVGGTRRPAAARPSAKSSVPVWLLVGGGAVALLVVAGIVFAVMGRSKSPTETVAVAPSAMPAAAHSEAVVTTAASPPPPAHQESATPQEPAAASPPAAVVAGPATEADCETLGRNIERAVMSADAGAFARLFDPEALIARAVEGIDVSPEIRAKLVESTRTEVGRTGLTRELTQVVSRGGRFDYLKVVERDGAKRALCRTIRDGSGVDFLEFLPASGGPDPRIADVFVYYSGDDLTQTMRRVILPQVARVDQGLVGRLIGAEPDIIRHRSELEQMAQKRLAGDWRGVLALYDALPESLRREKHVMMYAIHAASMSNEDDRYMRLVEELREQDPNDPAVDLHAIDVNAIRGDIAAAGDALRRLDALVGGDAFVRTQLALVLQRQGDRAGAERMRTEAVATEPDLIHPHVDLIYAAAASGDYDLAIRRVDEMRRHIPITPQKFREEFARLTNGGQVLLDSPAFRAWETRASSGT